MSDDYQILSQEKVAASKALVDMYHRLGRPESPLTESGAKMMDVIIATWEDLHPQESSLWYKMRSDYKENELEIHEQVKYKTGRSLASYPIYIYQVMKKLFPTFDAAKRENAIKMVKKWEMFQMANKV